MVTSSVAKDMGVGAEQNAVRRLDVGATAVFGNHPPILIKHIVPDKTIAARTTCASIAVHLCYAETSRLLQCLFATTAFVRNENNTVWHLAPPVFTSP